MGQGRQLSRKRDVLVGYLRRADFRPGMSCELEERLTGSASFRDERR